MPKDTPMGFLIGGCVFLFGFAAIWQILWLTICGFVGMLALLILHFRDEHPEYTIPAAEVEKLERQK